jgi:hypothetical protein
MARSGGPGNLSGVDYQLLFTAARLADALLSTSITTVHPEVHDLPPDPNFDVSTSAGRKPSVDDLVVVRDQKPPIHYSLKYRASHPYWDVSQLKSRGILDDFYRQHQQNLTADIVLVSQTPPVPELEDCLARVQGASPETLAHALDSAAAQKAFASIEAHLQKTFQCSQQDIIRFLQRVAILCMPANLLELEIGYILGPRVANVTVVTDALMVVALAYGGRQQALTAPIIATELAKRNLQLITPPDAVALQQQLDRVATMLTSVPSALRRDNLQHHIVRPEVKAIVEWVLNPVVEPASADGSGVGILPRHRSKTIVGGAGVGKTVVMRDLYQELRDRQIPVLALKADRMRAASKSELISRIQQEGLACPLFQALTILSTAARPAVVLVDQLDALSLCLSTDRSPLRSYAELLTELSLLPNVRFILACRSFDLQYDPDLSQFNSADRVEIPLLTDAQITDALQAFARTETAASLPGPLRELLRTPLYLDLYNALEAADRADQPITTAQELFRRFLNQKVLRDLPAHLSRPSVEQLLNQLASDLQRQQTLALPARQYEDDDSSAVEWLLSRGALLKLPGRPSLLQFFHQSFFDFVFARQFVRGKESLVQLVLASDQGLFFRATVRQVLSYLRGVNPLDYEQSLRDLLGGSIRFHFRLLVVQHLATISDPTWEEKKIVETCILPSNELRAPFLESALVRAWQEWLCEPPVFGVLVPELPPRANQSAARQLFHGLIYHAPDLCLRQLAGLPENEHKAVWVADVLLQMKDCADPLLPLLFDQYVAARAGEWEYAFWSALDKAAESHPDWIAGHLLISLADAKQLFSQHTQALQPKIVEKLYRCAPTTALTMCAQLFAGWLDREAQQYPIPPSHLLYCSPHFFYFDPNGSKSRKAPEVLYEATRDFLRTCATTLFTGQQALMQQWLYSRHSLLVQLGLEAAVAAPLLFQATIVQLFARPGWLQAAAKSHGTKHIHYLVRTWLASQWLALNLAEQRLLANAFLAALRPITWHKVDNTWPLSARYGYETYTYLDAIGPGQLVPFSDLQRLHAELRRRYGPTRITRPAAPIRNLSDERSPMGTWKTDRISNKHWLRSLRKYRAVAKNEHFFSDEGTYHGLVTELGKLIKNEPQAYLPLLQELLAAEDESTVPLLSNLQEADPVAAAPLIEQAFERGLLNDDPRQTTWLLRGVRDAQNEQPAFAVRHHLAVLQAHLTTNENMTSGANALMTGINTIGGAAINVLLQSRFSPDLYPEVLIGLQTIVKEGTWPVRAAALSYLAMLLNVAGPSNVVDMFCELVRDDYRLLPAGTWSLDYLMWRDFPRICRLFEAALAEPAVHETIVHYATIAWMHDEAGAYELLEQAWALSPDTRAASLKLLAEHYKSPTERVHFFDLFTRFLPGATDELRQAYDWCFTELSVTDFDPLISRLPGYFAVYGYDLERDFFLIEYLARCVRQKPVQGIEVLKQIFDCLNPERFYHSTEDSLQVLLEAYTALPSGEAGAWARTQALDLLDQLLLRADYRPQVRALVEASDRLL